MNFFRAREDARPMWGISASDESSSQHTYEAVKDEPRLIQDSLLSSGTLHLGEGGFPSGRFHDAAYEIHRVRLSPGDTVLFATDGLHEMRNNKEEDPSWGKLAEIWKACVRKSADEALDFLFEEMRASLKTAATTTTSLRWS
jgi:serine phosphatase RsbU (regulator of sigma subunit)